MTAQSCRGKTMIEITFAAFINILSIGDCQKNENWDSQLHHFSMLNFIHVDICTVFYWTTRKKTNILFHTILHRKGLFLRAHCISSVSFLFLKSQENLDNIWNKYFICHLGLTETRHNFLLNLPIIIIIITPPEKSKHL